MSTPNVGYGFVPCSHDDPKRSHYFSGDGWREAPCASSIKPCPTCAAIPNRKPVEIPDGWEMLQWSDVLTTGLRCLDLLDGEWRDWLGVNTPDGPIGKSVAEYFEASNHIAAFIHRKPVQPTVEPSKPAVDWSKPIQTRAGRKARLLGEIIGRDDPFAVAVMTEDGREDVLYYFASGKFYVNATCVNDIINTPERIEREVWLTLYRSGDISTDETEEAAKANRDKDRIACVRVQIDCNAGEGL
jgi:hypothetical protein